MPALGNDLGEFFFSFFLSFIKAIESSIYSYFFYRTFNSFFGLPPQKECSMINQSKLYCSIRLPMIKIKNFKSCPTVCFAYSVFQGDLIGTSRARARASSYLFLLSGFSDR